MIHGICMINSVCLFCHVNFFIAPNPFCKCHATTFKKKNFCHENLNFFLMKKIYSVTYSFGKNLVMFLASLWWIFRWSLNVQTFAIPDVYQHLLHHHL